MLLLLREHVAPLLVERDVEAFGFLILIDSQPDDGFDDASQYVGGGEREGHHGQNGDYLLDEEGNLLKYYSSAVKPLSDDIVSMLK